MSLIFTAGNAVEIVPRRWPSLWVSGMAHTPAAAVPSTPVPSVPLLQQTLHWQRACSGLPLHEELQLIPENACPLLCWINICGTQQGISSTGLLELISTELGRFHVHVCPPLHSTILVSTYDIHHLQIQLLTDAKSVPEAQKYKYMFQPRDKR